MAPLRVGMIGYGFMGKAHSFGYGNLPLIYGPDYLVERKVICGRNTEEVRKAADTLGWEEWETDWRKVVSRPDVDFVDVVTPGDSHSEIALAAIEAGKHVICEKPLANSVADARRMLAAAEKAGVRHMTGFSYRRVPAIALASKLMAEGRLGPVRHWRATWLADWIMPQDVPLIWRLQKERAGSGALGDLGSHIVDLAHLLVGGIAEVVGDWRTFRRERPLEQDPTRSGAVTVDDATVWLARFDNGALGTFEATRFAGGNRDRFSFEINGEGGSLRFNYNDPNKLDYFTWDDPITESGYKAIYMGNPAHPYSWWPNVLPTGYGDTFVNELYEWVSALRENRQPDPGFDAGVRCQAVTEAVERSIVERRWVGTAEMMA